MGRMAGSQIVDVRSATVVTATTFEPIMAGDQPIAASCLSPTTSREENAMRIRNLLVGILVEAILCFSPDRIIAQQTDGGSPNTSETDAVRSREIYKRDCLVC